MSENHNKKIQLIILPFAGGSGTSFLKMEEYLDENIEMTTIEYAGRGTHKQDGFITDYDEFLEDVATQIKQKQSGLPYAILGYSMGCAIAYDLVLREMIDGIPIHVFLCARGSIISKQRTQKHSCMSESEFIQEMVTLGGIDDRILNNQRFLSIYMKPVRADYVIWDQYQYAEGRFPCDLTAIYSPKDYAAEGVHDWTKLTEKSADYFEIGDSHFFIFNHWRETAEIVNNHLNKYIY